MRPDPFFPDPFFPMRTRLWGGVGVGGRKASGYPIRGVLPIKFRLDQIFPDYNQSMFYMKVSLTT